MAKGYYLVSVKLKNKPTTTLLSLYCKYTCAHAVRTEKCVHNFPMANETSILGLLDFAVTIKIGDVLIFFTPLP